jgi:O-antigen ligase
LVAEETVYQRLGSYKVALLMFLAKPLLGYGKDEGHFSTLRAEYLTRIGTTRAELVADMGPPHNQYVNTVVQYGLLGLVIYGAILFLIVKSGATLMRMFPHSESAERQFVVLFLGMLVTYLVQGMFADVAAYTMLGSLLYLFAGVLEGLRLRTFPLESKSHLRDAIQGGTFLSFYRGDRSKPRMTWRP